MRSGVLTSISSRQRSAISSHPLLERKDFGPTRSLQLDTPTYAPASRAMTFMIPHVLRQRLT